jgi:hypothetical protein
MPTISRLLTVSRFHRIMLHLLRLLQQHGFATVVAIPMTVLSVQVAVTEEVN